jgi:hypothetical protein
MDTPMPFLKVGHQVFQGEVTPLIGDEVILGLIRSEPLLYPPPPRPGHPYTFPNSPAGAQLTKGRPR